MTARVLHARCVNAARIHDASSGRLGVFSSCVLPQQLYAAAAEAASYMRAYNHLPAPPRERASAGIDTQRKRLSTSASGPSFRWRVYAEYSEPAQAPPAYDLDACSCRGGHMPLTSSRRFASKTPSLLVTPLRPALRCVQTCAGVIRTSSVDR